MRPSAPVNGKENLERVIVLYDSECGVCSRLVNWLILRDRHQRLTFAGLHGTTAADLRGRHLSIPIQTDTLVLVRGRQPDERIWLRSQAVLGVFALLPWPWRALGVFRVLPSVLLDPPYRLLARLRGHLGTQPVDDEAPAWKSEDRFLP